MRILITGTEGFIGSTLLGELHINSSHMIYGTLYGSRANNMAKKYEKDDRVHLQLCDVSNVRSVKEMVSTAQPDIVYHLAAQSMPTVSWLDPDGTFRSNCLGTFNLLKTLSDVKHPTRVIIASSSAVYGVRDKGSSTKIDEKTPFNPTTVYAVSKVTTEMLGHMFDVYGLDIIIVRPFNITGPGKIGDACSDFTRQIIECEKGKRANLEVGNLKTIRDFTDGRDCVKALLTITERGLTKEIYNICSGIGRKMMDVLNLAINCAGLKDVPIVHSGSLDRPYDDPYYVGNNKKLYDLGWAPVYSFEQTIKDMLNWWRGNIN